MMQSRDQIALVLVSLVLIQSSAAKLLCWDCDSLTNNDCGEPFNSSTISVTDCSNLPDGSQCRIINYPNERIIRGCVIDDQSIEQLNEASIWYCSGDGCNFATTTHRLPTMVIFMAVPLIIAACNLLQF